MIFLPRHWPGRYSAPPFTLNKSPRKGFPLPINKERKNSTTIGSFIEFLLLGEENFIYFSVCQIIFFYHTEMTSIKQLADVKMPSLNRFYIFTIKYVYLHLSCKIFYRLVGEIAICWVVIHDHGWNLPQNMWNVMLTLPI